MPPRGDLWIVTGLTRIRVQANYISLYVLTTDVVKANRAALRGLSVGKGCARFPSPEKVDFGVVGKLLADTRRSSNRIC